MKKLGIFLTTTMLTTSMAAAAAAGTSDCNRMTGFYLGGNLGYGAGTVKDSDSDGYGHGGLKGLIGGIHLGYQKAFGIVVAGLEGTANLSNTKLSSKNKDDGIIDKTSFKRKHAFGIAARLGVVINNCLIYTKAGYDNAKFSFHESEAKPASQNKNLHGIVPGIGFETMITNNLMFGGEWTYTFYQGKKLVRTIDGDIENDKLKHRIGDFKLRLSYKF